MPSPAFEASLPFVLRWEGGYVDRPDDPGGATNKGVTQKVYDAWRSGLGLPARPVLLIEDAEVRTIYESGYWLPPRCDLLKRRLDLAHFDTAVNMGARRAIRFLQASLGCDVDGQFGPATRQAADECDLDATLSAYCDTRESFYRRLVETKPSLGVFLKGWLNRLGALRGEVGLAGREAGRARRRASAVVDFGDTGYVARIPDAGVDPDYDSSEPSTRGPSGVSVEVPERRWWPLVPPATTSGQTRRKGSSREARTPPIDPGEGPMLALAGRVVTMVQGAEPLAEGVVYIDKGSIVDVRERRQPPPAGFEATAILQTGGTIFPGLIELHNHLSFDALPLWTPVPRAFSNRGQWADHDDYRRLVSGPMTVIGKTPALLPALVRYVECKCLLAGVTTSQGIRLNSNAGVSRYYAGVVRNVEQTREAALPEARTRIEDVDAADARAFREALIESRGKRCHLLHLSEGVTDPREPLGTSRRHFLALEVAPGDWAITDALAGIHSAGLLPGDFDVMASRGGSMVWSPFSNLLLYGDTTRVAEARRAGVAIGLGSDWSPTGSKNLLGELKVAWLYSQSFLDGLFTARELVAMATTTAARILKWQDAVGSLEAGKRADLLVIDATGGDAYEALIRATETSVRLVLVNGVPRYGAQDLMNPLGVGDQTLRVGGETRRLFLKQETVPGEVAALSLSSARRALRAALRDIRRLARELERARPADGRTRRGRALDSAEHVTWSLALDEIRDTGVDLRPRLPYRGPRDFTGPERFSRRAARAAARAPLSEILRPVALDPLTVVDDSDFLDRVAAQPNLPDAIRRGLRGLF